MARINCLNSYLLFIDIIMIFNFSNCLDHILIMNDVLRLIIYDATLSDSNVYTCRASNEIGVAEKHYTVIVKGDIFHNFLIDHVVRKCLFKYYI